MYLGVLLHQIEPVNGHIRYNHVIILIFIYLFNTINATAQSCRRWYHICSRNLLIRPFIVSIERPFDIKLIVNVFDLFSGKSVTFVSYSCCLILVSAAL